MLKRSLASSRRRQVVGITGALGAGKSTVAKMFESLGARRIDCDRLVHRLLACSHPVRRDIIRVFGKGILGPGGSIDRKRLAREVFGPGSDRRKLGQLGRTVHPRVLTALRREMARARAAGRFLVVEVPLLYEAGMEKMFDSVVVVTSGERELVERAAGALGVRQAEARRRLRAQWPQRRKARLADYVILNSGPLRATRARVRAIWKELRNGA